METKTKKKPSRQQPAEVPFGARRRAVAAARRALGSAREFGCPLQFRQAVNAEARALLAAAAGGGR